jgi:hypothetical protein
MIMKSNTKKISGAVVGAVLLFGTACTKDFAEINTDPTLVTAEIIKPSMLFTAVLKNSIFDSYNTSVITEYSGYYSNQGSVVIFQNANWTSPFNTFYKTYLINTAEVVRLTAGNPKLVNEHAMGRIWKALLFSQLTDLYGDVPYFEAVQNVVDVVNQPKYDTQKDIYTDLLKELKEAAAQLSNDATLASFGQADILMSGNVDRWKRFANSLRLRLALRISYADPILAKQHIAEVISQPLIDDNSFNVSLTTVDGANTNNRNPLYDDPLNSYPLWTSFTVADNLKKLNDPRLPIFSLPASDGVSGYRGRPISLGTNEITYTEENTARLQNQFRSAEHPIMVMNAAEVSFLRAEAALMNFTGENAQQLFTTGITQSLNQYSVAQSEINKYLASASALLTGATEAKLEQIITQKFLAIFYESNEAYAEFRRTGYPRIWTGSNKGSTNGEIPRRLTYPLAEYAKNEVNVKAATSKLAQGDNYLSRIWWDAKVGLPFHHAKQGIFPPE